LLLVEVKLARAVPDNTTAETTVFRVTCLPGSRPYADLKLRLSRKENGPAYPGANARRGPGRKLSIRVTLQDLITDSAL